MVASGFEDFSSPFFLILQVYVHEMAYNIPLSSKQFRLSSYIPHFTGGNGSYFFSDTYVMYFFTFIMYLR